MSPTPLPFAGFDGPAQYQMVPSNGGVRSMALWVQPDETEDVIVYPADPNKIGLFGLYTVQGKAAIRGAGYFVAKNSAIRFFMKGRDPGPTSLIVETVGGRMRTFLLVSVKPPKQLYYQLYVLWDAVNKPNLAASRDEMKIIMADVEKFLLMQANIKLTSTGPVLNPIVADDLKTPIVIDRPDNFKKITDAALALNPPNAHLHIFRTWDLVYSNDPTIIGSNTLSCCFVENLAPSPIANCLYAHEIGHGLGLIHSDDNFDIMFPKILSNSRYSMHDIETMNFGYPLGVV